MDEGVNAVCGDGTLALFEVLERRAAGIAGFAFGVREGVAKVSRL